MRWQTKQLAYFLFGAGGLLIILVARSARFERALCLVAVMDKSKSKRGVLLMVRWLPALQWPALAGEGFIVIRSANVSMPSQRFCNLMFSFSACWLLS